MRRSCHQCMRGSGPAGGADWGRTGLNQGAKLVWKEWGGNGVTSFVPALARKVLCPRNLFRPWQSGTACPLEQSQQGTRTRSDFLCEQNSLCQTWASWGAGVCVGGTKEPAAQRGTGRTRVFKSAAWEATTAEQRWQEGCLEVGGEGEEVPPQMASFWLGN